ncbi:Protein CBG19321 [Caenorhabditis briggsae]|uniref:Protein CBG19321 n=1 Tax=Caenorhabditis briggsae TaxID=6238 RepID=A8XVC6_CAEBR|nr:Protein CBG19321 [Caenorhabditis briggsae]CAP36593.2 Protein CBG19321 [Caenorhabditis briggsae]
MAQCHREAYKRDCLASKYIHQTITTTSTLISKCKPSRKFSDISTSFFNFKCAENVFSAVLLALGLFSGASAQLAAWPSQSYSPFYQALFGGASTPVLSAPVAKTAPSAIPLAAPALPVPVAAAPAFAPTAPVLAAPAPVLAAPAPVFAAPRPVFAAPAIAPAFAPAFAPVAPVLRAPVLAAPAPVFAAPALAPVAPVLAAPRLVPAYAPFARAAMFIGSNKAKTA